MPIYYMNIYNDDVTLDYQGIELRDDIAAHDRAVVEARVLAAESVRLGHLSLRHYIEITDSNRAPIGKVTFGDAVELRNDAPATTSASAPQRP